jgi:hypothetical protein
VTLTFDPKINSGQLLVMTDQDVEYEVFVINSDQDNEQKPF